MRYSNIRRNNSTDRIEARNLTGFTRNGKDRKSIHETHITRFLASKYMSRSRAGRKCLHALSSRSEGQPREITKGIEAGPKKIKGRGKSDQDNVHKYTVYGIMNLIHL